MVDGIAHFLAPWNVILGVLLGLIGLALYLRKWLKSIAADANESARQSTEAAKSAKDANTQATAAGVAAATAGRHAKTATDASVDTNKAMEWLVTELVAKDEALAESLLARENLKDRLDTAVAAVAYQAATRSIPIQRDQENP